MSEGQGRSKLPTVHEVAPALGQQFCQLDCIRVVGQPSLRPTHALDLALYSSITRLYWASQLLPSSPIDVSYCCQYSFADQKAASARG